MRKSVNTLKGQVTLFIILGIVIVAVFGFIYYIAQQKTITQLNSQTQQVLSKLSEPAFDYFISSCLDKTLEEGLVTIGNQGGYFFKNQPGYIFSQDYEIPKTQDKISYLIYEDYYPDFYPCRTEDSPPDFCRYPLGSTPFFLGNPKLASLTQIKKQLESYIVEEFQKCADLEWIKENYPEFKGYEFDIDKSAIKANIKFLSNQVLVYLDYPIKIKIGGQEPVIQFLHFSAKSDIKFFRIYNLVKDIISFDVTNLDYSATEKNLQSLALLNNLDLAIKIKPLAQGDDLFILNDSGYVFRFARKNRPPVLDYVNQHPPPQDYPDLYDFLVIKGQPINLNPTAKDPDEDIVNIQQESVDSSVGWKNITITATDNYLSDNQIVRILIDNKTPATYSMYSYPEFPFISYEDPFYLNASSSINSLDPNVSYEFIWEIDKGQQGYETFTATDENPLIKIPLSTNISTIKNQLENINWILFKVNVNYPNYNYSETQRKEINIKQCLPHKSSSPPYPFNTTDAFLSNHSCCNDDFTIAGNNTICHKKPAGKLFCKSTRLYSSQYNAFYCDGSRGNVCLGKSKIINSEFDTGKCGIRGEENCPNTISKKCQNKTPYVQTDSGICYGKTGCEKFCDSELVQTNNGIDCGCLGNNGKPCDLNYDGNFNGICKTKYFISASCIGDNQ